MLPGSLPAELALDPPAMIVIQGGGSTAIEAALYARFLGYRVLLAAPDGIAPRAREWASLPMLVPYADVVTPLGLGALAAQQPGFCPPPGTTLWTYGQWASDYLIPLTKTDLLADSVQDGTRLVEVRQLPPEGDLDDFEEGSPFRLELRLETAGGEEETLLAAAVVDASEARTAPRPAANYAHFLSAGGSPHAAAAWPCELELDKPTMRQELRWLVVGAGPGAAALIVRLAEALTPQRDAELCWLDEAQPPCRRLHELARERMAALETSPRFSVFAREGVEGRIRCVSGDAPASPRAADGLPADFHRLVVLPQVHDRIPIPFQLAGGQRHADLAAGARGRDVTLRPPWWPTGWEHLLTDLPHAYLLSGPLLGNALCALPRDGHLWLRELFHLIVGRRELDLYHAAGW